MIFVLLRPHYKMYIKKLEIKNIRSITGFEMTFEKPAGWHVLIGDNGTGKSTIIQAISLVLVGPEEIRGIKPNWNEWLQWQTDKGSIRLQIAQTPHLDMPPLKLSSLAKKHGFPIEIRFTKTHSGFVEIDEKNNIQAKNTIWSNQKGWFSTGYGPFRRFTGGSYEKSSVFDNPNYGRLAAHLSLFGEDVALTEATKWLIGLKLKVFENTVDKNILENIKKLINSKSFLPNNAQLKEIHSEGVTFQDGYGASITVNQMSDGYRSILSLTFELIRQLVKIYGAEAVFASISKEMMVIDLPGIVLIDEIDVHLHPTWQTRIGQWFTQYFPKIQFIVTTHSALVCRACENGSIWQLAAPNSKMPSGEVKGIDRNRLIYGNVLDAYGTEVFGKGITSDKSTQKMIEELAELNMKNAMGKISTNEQTRMNHLRTIFTTDDVTSF
jgi:energy-coupling factor transporter ATP-binding protein EcfA2